MCVGSLVGCMRVGSIPVYGARSLESYTGPWMRHYASTDEASQCTF
jgi:hypothetical protein